MKSAGKAFVTGILLPVTKQGCTPKLKMIWQDGTIVESARRDLLHQAHVHDTFVRNTCLPEPRVVNCRFCGLISLYSIIQY